MRSGFSVLALHPHYRDRYAMGILGRYVFRQVAGTLVIVTFTLTAILWLTAALRQIDLLTAKSQTLLIFLQATLLSLPAMLVVVVPIGFFIACVYCLNRLNGDSELIVMGASGASPNLVMRPVLMVGALVLIFMYLCTLYMVPATWRMLKELSLQINTDLISGMMVEGQFSTPQDGMTFHVRDRLPDGTMLGIMVHDRRGAEVISTYLAKRANLIEENGEPILIMQDGSVQRKTNSTDDPANAEFAIVVFDRYLLGISQFSENEELGSLKPRERSLIELFNPPADDPQYARNPGSFYAELADRFASPLYPIVFALIAFAALGRPRSNREHRLASTLSAIGAIFLVRFLGFVATNGASLAPVMIVFVFAVPIAAGIISVLVITGRIKTGKLNDMIYGHVSDAAERIAKLVRARLARQA